jgi:uronate dehydrogenase
MVSPHTSHGPNPAPAAAPSSHPTPADAAAGAAIASGGPAAAGAGPASSGPPAMDAADAAAASGGPAAAGAANAGPASGGSPAVDAVGAAAESAGPAAADAASVASTFTGPAAGAVGAAAAAGGPAPLGTVLLTGSAGGVGGFLRAGLPGLGWTLRCYDIVPTPDVPDAIVADIRDTTALQAAMSGVDAVVHLAGIPKEDHFDRILSSNIDGTYQVFEAARQAGVPRIVYASSNHAVGFYPRQPLAPADGPPRPDTYYGLSKVFGEALARLYVDRFGMQAACLRIGSCFARPRSARMLSTWLSPDDAVRLVHACLTAPDLDYAVVYGTSANTRGWWDLEPGRRLGFHPVDDAEKYAAEILAEAGEPDPDDPEHAYLGGSFTGR